LTARAEPLPRGAVWIGMGGTLAVHVAALAALLASVRVVSRPEPPMYAVELVAAPASTGTARPAPEATPPPAPAPPVPKTPAKPVPRPKPVPVKAPPRAEAKPAPRTASPMAPLPGETPGTGRDLANVKLAGKEFPYPEYLRNLVAQIYRRWNRPLTDLALQAEVGFVILRDGSVRDIRIVTKSGSYSFDLEAQGAIEASATAKAFGPLPAGYPADYLQIGFLFTPRQSP
jgi:outer membrane biosynthesis protein TonB